MLWMYGMLIHLSPDTIMFGEGRWSITPILFHFVNSSYLQDKSLHGFR